MSKRVVRIDDSAKHEKVQETNQNCLICFSQEKFWFIVLLWHQLVQLITTIIHIWVTLNHDPSPLTKDDVSTFSGKSKHLQNISLSKTLVWAMLSKWGSTEIHLVVCPYNKKGERKWLLLNFNASIISSHTNATLPYTWRLSMVNVQLIWACSWETAEAAWTGTQMHRLLKTATENMPWEQSQSRVKTSRNLRIAWPLPFAKLWIHQEYQLKHVTSRIH